MERKELASHEIALSIVKELYKSELSTSESDSVQIVQNMAQKYVDLYKAAHDVIASPRNVEKAKIR